MKSKDRHLGVLNMPEATEVCLHRRFDTCKDCFGDCSGGRGEEVETEQEKEATADHISQDHCKQDLLHHQPPDEGKVGVG